MRYREEQKRRGNPDSQLDLKLQRNPGRMAIPPTPPKTQRPKPPKAEPSIPQSERLSKPHDYQKVMNRY